MYTKKNERFSLIRIINARVIIYISVNRTNCSVTRNAPLLYPYTASAYRRVSNTHGRINAVFCMCRLLTTRPVTDRHKAKGPLGIPLTPSGHQYRLSYNISRARCSSAVYGGPYNNTFPAGGWLVGGTRRSINRQKTFFRPGTAQNARLSFGFMCSPYISRTYAIWYLRERELRSEMFRSGRTWSFRYFRIVVNWAIMFVTKRFNRIDNSNKDFRFLCTNKYV